MTQPETPLHRVRAALAEVLDQFRHDTHPGERCKQTGHVRVATIDRWHAVLTETAEAARGSDPQQADTELELSRRAIDRVRHWADELDHPKHRGTPGIPAPVIAAHLRDLTQPRP